MVFARALAVDPRERPRDAGTFWKALRQAVGEAEAVASSPEGAAFIPDLVPVSRTRRSMPPSAPSGLRFDFDDAGGAGPSLDLDLPADEPIPRRSLTPSGVSALPAAQPSLAPAPPPGVQLAAMPRAPTATPSLTPKPEGRVPSNPPNISLQPASGGVSRAELPAPVAMPRRSVPSVPPTLARRLAPGVSLAGASVLLTLLDRLYAATSGEVFSLGPIRTTWIAAVLLAAGVGLVGLRLVALRQNER
jgi:serine/threonine-protein kinase